MNCSLYKTAVVVLAVIVLFGCKSIDAAERPNVVVILTDDQGWGDLSCHGNTNLSTPHIDSLQRDGASFDYFYVCPVCAPTRAEFLTGRYHPRSGAVSVTEGKERMSADEVTIADTFKSAGYATAAFGKWHNGTQHPYHPNARGFDEFYGFCSGHWGDYFSPPLEHKGELVRGNGYVTDDFTDKALQFIEAHRNEPFFVYLPYNTPHAPMQVPDRWYDPFRDRQLTLRGAEPDREDIEFTRAALAMCENIDWNVGRLLAMLDQLGLAENTIVVFFCDNGPNSARWNDGLKGQKASTDEGGVRSPLFVRWPKSVAPGTEICQIAGAIDLFPTLAELAGIEFANNKPLDGMSLKPLLTGESPDWPDRLIFSHWNGKVSVRSPRYRLDHRGRLFDLSVDPGQRRDIASLNDDIARRLRAAATRWRNEMLTQRPKDGRPFDVGYPGSVITQLPARDAQPHGNVKRSNRFPNCSYFTNWTSADDSITWSVWIHEAGQYVATLYYTCRDEDVGSTLELHFGNNFVRRRVDFAYDPLLHGGEHDRVPRQSSYVKDFKPLKMGMIELPCGPGILRLKASRIPGSRVIDLRMLVLQRITSGSS